MRVDKCNKIKNGDIMSIQITEKMQSNSNSIELTCVCPQCEKNSLMLVNESENNSIKPDQEVWIFMCLSCNWKQAI